MRTKSELEEKIKKLQFEIFGLDMKDNWDQADYSLMYSMRNELLKLETELKELEREKDGR